jgi:hypothetical protein
MQFSGSAEIAARPGPDWLKMQAPSAADRIAATARMLARLRARLPGGATESVLTTNKRLHEAIADLTRLELKLRARRWCAPQDVPDR